MKGFQAPAFESFVSGMVAFASSTGNVNMEMSHVLSDGNIIGVGAVRAPSLAR